MKTSHYLVFSAGLAALCCSACKRSNDSAAFQTGGAAQGVSLGAAPVTVFSWTNSANPLAQIVKDVVSHSRKKNNNILDITDIPDGAVYGYGIYVATDPLQSSIYGSELLCLALPRKRNWKDGKNEGVEDIRGPASILRYIFAPGLFPQTSKDITGEFAAVIRDFDAFSLDVSEKISFRDAGTGGSLNQQALATANERLSKGNLCGALKPFENQFFTFSKALLAAADAPLASMNMLIPFRTFAKKDGVAVQGELSVFAELNKQTALIDELSAAGVLKTPYDSKNSSGFAMEALDIAFRILDAKSEDDVRGDAQSGQANFTVYQAQRALLAMKLIAPGTKATTFLGLRQAIVDTLQANLADWGKAHPNEVEFGRRYLKALLPRSLRSL